MSSGEADSGPSAAQQKDEREPVAPPPPPMLPPAAGPDCTVAPEHTGDATSSIEPASSAAAAAAEDGVAVELAGKLACELAGEKTDAAGSSPSSRPLPTARPVVLRAEVASKTLAQVIAWSVALINSLFVWLAITLLTLRERDLETVAQLRPFYTAEVILASVALGALLLSLAWFLLTSWRSRREGRLWTKRQHYFANTAFALLVLQVCYATSILAAFAVVAATPDCGYPWATLYWIEYFQWLFFTSTMLFILARLQSARLYRGPGALDMHPDFRLRLDRPISERPGQLKWLLALWTILQALGLGKMIEKLVKNDNAKFQGGCDALLDSWTCPPTGYEIAAAVVLLVFVLAYVAYWLWLLRRVLQDHRALPWHKYRATLIFARTQARVLGPVISAVILSTIFLSLVPAFKDDCWSMIDAQIGNIPVDLSLTLVACVFAFLYQPCMRSIDSPALQDFHQRFAWTQASLPREAERRNRELLEAPRLERQSSLSQLIDYLPDRLARLAGLPSSQEAVAQLRAEPLFCMETCVKLFYWMRLAYRVDDALTHPFVNARTALKLCGLRHFEIIWDDTTDTHACIGYSDTEALVAFRGTQTLQNVLTDVKAWLAPLQPPRKHEGRVLKAHAGFLGAWLHAGFNTKVLARLKELDARSPQPLRLWVAGHSLGGALAVLASLELKAQHPQSQLTCYVYGCPRVGNYAFCRAFNEAVPDCWAVINDKDPVPWIPKLFFHRCGKRVTIDAVGNCILRPTYFETSLTHRGTSPKQHLAGSYAQSLAAVLRSQFVHTKALEGGPEGVAALVAAVDLGKALVLTGMDLESLADERALPQSQEALAAKAEAAAMRAGAITSLHRAREPRAGCASCSCLVLGRGASEAASRGEEDGAEGESYSAADDGTIAADSAQQGCWPRRQRRLGRSGSAGSQQPAPQTIHWRRLVSGLTPTPSQDLAGADGAAAAAAAGDRLQPGRMRPGEAVATTFPITAAALEAGGAAAAGVAAAVTAAADGARQAVQCSPALRRLSTGMTEVTMHSALSHPDELILDEHSGAWMQLEPAPSGSGGGGGGGDGSGRRPAEHAEQKLDLTPGKP